MIGPGVEIVLGGENRTIRFTHNALARLEELQLGWLKIGAAYDAGPITVIRVMLWAVLVGSIPTLTLEQVGTWLDAVELRDVNVAVWRAYIEAIPKSVEEGNGRPPLPTTTGPSLVGSPSGPSNSDPSPSGA